MRKKKNIRIDKEAEKERKIFVSKRLVGFLFCCIAIFLVLIFRIGYIQFAKGDEYKESAYQQQTINRIISPKRGTIYDSTGKALALSADVDTITINPNKIVVNDKDEEVAAQKTKERKELVAKALSDIFSLDYNEVYEKVTSTASVETIVRKVAQEEVNELENWMSENEIYSGINIDADTKRAYPYENFASNLIGFCGNDNQGLEGLESRWDSVLTGTPGKIVTSKDSVNQEIPDENQRYIPAENGSDIVLTIDYNIQTIAEKYLKQAVEENDCKRGGNVIIMNPDNGDILAMATYPDYNLNDPFTPNTQELKDSWDKLSSEDKNNSLYSMWKNIAVTNGYEPGSVFKLITASIALEENLINTDDENDFVCTGSEKVADRTIKCWRSYNPHGYQSLRDALKNSCNPAFIQLGEKIGVRTFYKYFSAFGFFEPTNAGISGEIGGYFHSEENVGPVELATMSFGQRFTITPLQMITAVCSIANDGVLMEPRIVKQIINSDTGATTNLDPVEVRKVLSEETCEQMKDMMESVVTDGTGRYAAVKGYSIGGKTGTSEPSPSNPDEGYTASYIAISPIVDTKVAILVTLYNPTKDSHEGGAIAAPVVSQILSEVLPYMEIPSDSELQSNTTDNNVTVNDVRNKTVTEAVKILENAGFDVQINVSGDANEVLVTDQVPKPGVSLLKGSIVCLYTEENDVRISVNVPNLKGKTLSQARSALKDKNLNISYEGTGQVVSQSITEGTTVEEGTIVEVVLKEELQDAH